MKKSKYYYQSYFQKYESGNEALMSKNDLLDWHSKTGVKPHTEMYKKEQYVYTWKFVEEKDLPQYFIYIGSVDVDVNQDVDKFDRSESISDIWPVNWKNLEKRKVG